IGDKEHPEVKGIISFGKNIRVFNELEEIKKAEIDENKNYCVLTQTTLNKKKLEKIKSFLENHYSNVNILDKVCGATQVRQEAVEELSKKVDILLVIGGKNSSNTKKLYDISKAINKNTYLIENEKELEENWFTDCKKVGITAGASTPEEIVINIENKIRGIN
ncbi:MAG: 4-hydroxy-3-methylbut-2-enyl diphosphate reductase, partial [Fusobacterium sp.]|nr:4-hydroxy-3-methylbut-2-enyl diphosphate reductase [Fusobacterium sp.]